MLLAIDPGMNSPGVALFSRELGDSTLKAAGRVDVPTSFATLPAGARWMHVARLVVDWIGIRGVDKVIYEKPQWYERSKSKGDPNQLVGIAGVAANVTGMLSMREPIEVVSPTPAEWVGQCPKVCPTCEGRKTEKRTDGKKGRGKKVVICPDCDSSAWGTPRGRRIASRLRPEELARCPDQNDAIDAVGLGLWALGRFTPISVFSNGNDGR